MLSAIPSCCRCFPSKWPRNLSAKTMSWPHFQILWCLLLNVSLPGETPAMGDDKAPRAAVLEILQDALRGQSPAQAAGNGAGIPSVFCGKTKVFLANSLVSAVPWLMPLECSCLRAILAQREAKLLPSQWDQNWAFSIQLLNSIKHPSESSSAKHFV